MTRLETSHSSLREDAVPMRALQESNERLMLTFDDHTTLWLAFAL